MCSVIVILQWQKMPKHLKFFSSFILFSFIIQVSSIIIIDYLKHASNLWLLHTFTLGEYILLSLFYFYLFEENSKFKTIIKIILPIGTILIILNTILLQPFSEFNSNAKTFVQVLLISYAIYYFYIVSTKEILTNSYVKAIHIINSAVLLYYSGSLFIFMFSNLAISLYKGISLGFWLFNSILYLIFIIVVSIGLWKAVFSQRNSNL